MGPEVTPGELCWCVRNRQSARSSPRRGQRLHMCHMHAPASALDICRALLVVLLMLPCQNLQGERVQMLRSGRGGSIPGSAWLLQPAWHPCACCTCYWGL